MEVDVLLGGHSLGIEGQIWIGLLQVERKGKAR